MSSAPAPEPPRPSRSHLFRWLAANPLLHFLVLGGLLFALAPRPMTSDLVRIDQQTISTLARAEARRRGTPALSEADSREVLIRTLEDEVLYREALRLGLDQNDPVVRQRLIQKVLLLAEDLGAVQRPPSEEELRAFFEENQARWQRPLALRFVHVFASTQRRAELEGLRERVLAHDTGSPETAPPFGESFPISRDVPLTSVTELAQAFGASFADALATLEPRTWSQPIASRYGWHLVKVLERREPGPARLEEVRDRLGFELALDRKRRATAAYLRQAFSRYRVEVDGRPFEGYEPTRREPARPGEGD